MTGPVIVGLDGSTPAQAAAAYAAELAARRGLEVELVHGPDPGPNIEGASSARTRTRGVRA